MAGIMVCMMFLLSYQISAAVSAEPKLIALTFDDGPSLDFTPKVLKILDDEDIKATFFLVGKWLPGKRALVQEMVDDGQQIGNHTFDHVKLTGLSADEIRSELNQTDNALTDITGQTSFLVRPPFGARNCNMLQSFTRNYEDNSTEAGFQFTFYCDICQDGFKSSFVESETYKKSRSLRGMTRGAGVIGSLLGGRLGDLGWSLERGGDLLSERFDGMSPEWQKEHENAFEHAKNEAQKHFHRCHGCHKWVCDSCYNEDEMLCADCAPRQEVAVAKARASAMLSVLRKAKQDNTGACRPGYNM